MNSSPESLRVRARSPNEAKKRHRRFLQRAISCVSSSAQLYIGDSPLGPSGFVSLASRPDYIRLTTKAGLPLFLRVTQRLQVIPDHRYAGEYRLTTRAYYYGIRLSPEDTDPVIAWHWDSSESRYSHPHVHTEVRDPRAKGVKLHIPTGRRVSLEQVLRFLIDEWEVEPVLADWSERLADTQTRFETFQVQDGYPGTPV